MHLRSMRRSVMKICQFCIFSVPNFIILDEVGYCSILLSCTKENCYIRNAQRNELLKLFKSYHSIEKESLKLQLILFLYID